MKIRKDGRFCAQARVNGKVVSVYAKSEEEARLLLSLKVRLGLPRQDISDSPTLHEIAESIWLETISKLKPKSISRYTSIYKLHIRDFLGNMPVKEIDRPTLNRWIASLPSNPTKRISKGVCSLILTCAQEHGFIEVNHASRLKLPPKSPKRDRALEPEKAAEVIAFFEGSKLGLPVWLALVLGLRLGEICGLKWEDLNRQRGELHIQRQRQSQSGSGTFDTTLKSTSSDRILRLPRGFIEQIDQNGDLDCEYICTYKQKAWIPQTVSEFWQKEKELVGLI